MLNSAKFVIIVSLATVMMTAVATLAVNGWLIKDDDAASVPSPNPSSRVFTAISTVPGRRTRVPGEPALAKVRQIAEPLPPVTEVPVVSAREAEGKIADREFVLGVVVGSEARAYCLNMLADPERELLNDVLGGEPIAIAWCDQCQCPRVFSRKVDGKTLTLHLTGETLASNMVLADSETGSEWSQLPGTAISGALKGKQLKPIPAVWTDWNTWRTKHADTSLYVRDRVVPIYQHVEDYTASMEERQYFNKFQWGLAQGDKARSWPFSQLARQPVVNDTFDGRAIVVIFDRRTSTVTGFERELNGEVLNFRRDGALVVDEQTGSVWDSITGQALDGPRRGQRLTAVPGVVAMTSNWQAFHPNGEEWTARALNSPKRGG